MSFFSNLKELSRLDKAIAEKNSQIAELDNRISDKQGIIDEVKAGVAEECEKQRRAAKAEAELVIEQAKANADEIKASVKSTVKELENRRSDLKAAEIELKEKKKQIMEADEIVLMESFALYRPSYAFTTVAEYKEQLDKVRDKQKRMIKDGTSAFATQNWAVNGSYDKGKKLQKDMIKLCLRSFNTECDSAISNVKFNNFDRCKQRIEKSAQSINATTKMMSISISTTYINLKIDELKLALEYQIKKQEEKERLAELRAQQREEARVAKEIEEARKASLKEQKHYQQALDSVVKQIEACKDDEERTALNAKMEELSSKLNAISEEIEQIDYREANQKAGYVYVISNIGAFGENVYKIGMTRRLEPQERIDELGDASVPFRFDVHAMIFSEDAPKLEAALHKAFENNKLNMINPRKEFFRVSLDEIKSVVHANHDKSVEFIDIPDADQYRETQQIKEQLSQSA